MKSFKINPGGVNMITIKNFFNFITVKSIWILIIVGLMGFSLGCSAEGKINGGTVNFPVKDPALEWVSPEEAGWSSTELQEAHEFAIQTGCQAVLALYDGKLFFSRGNINRNYAVDSIRETFLNALNGIHEAQGDINLNATLEDLHIDDIPPGLTHAEKQARVEHLLMSRSGVYHKAAAEDQTMIDERPARGSHAPDTFFYHNNWDVNALGAIFEQETGEEICKAFKKEIADVVEMVDYSITNCSYQYQWNKSLHPAYHFKMSPRDLAKFGALYQKNGRWKDSRIIQQDWIDDSTMAYSTMPETGGLGYGYLWKIIPEDSDLGQMIGYEGYYHIGADDYVLVVIPDLKLVIVQRYNQNYNWEDPEDDSFELTMRILDARLGG
jgi:hypothetical protein